MLIAGPDDVRIIARAEFYGGGDINRIHQLDYEVTKIILSVITLFDDLEKQRLIFLYGNLLLNNQTMEIGDRPVGESIEYNFNYSDVRQIIYEYVGREIFITETLKDIVKNNFVSREDRRLLRELRLTQGGVGLTFLALAFSIYGTMWHTGTVTVENDVKSPARVTLKEEQVAIIQKTADEVIGIKRILQNRLKKPKPTNHY